MIQGFEGECRGGVAGNDQQFDILADEEGGDLHGVAGDRLRRLGPVGDPGGISQVDGVFLGEGLDDLLQDRKSSDTGVENAYCFPGHAVKTSFS